MIFLFGLPIKWNEKKRNEIFFFLVIIILKIVAIRICTYFCWHYVKRWIISGHTRVTFSIFLYSFQVFFFLERTTVKLDFFFFFPFSLLSSHICKLRINGFSLRSIVQCLEICMINRKKSFLIFSHHEMEVMERRAQKLASHSVATRVNVDKCLVRSLMYLTHSLHANEER